MSSKEILSRTGQVIVALLAAALLFWLLRHLEIFLGLAALGPGVCAAFAFLESLTTATHSSPAEPPLLAKPDSAPPRDTVTPLLLGLALGWWFGRGPCDDR